MLEHKTAIVTGAAVKKVVAEATDRCEKVFDGEENGEVKLTFRKRLSVMEAEVAQAILYKGQNTHKTVLTV